MIILELISPQQRTIEQKYLLTTQKKSQLLKKKKTANIVTALLPARDQLQKLAEKKANFWSTDLTKNIKKNTKNLTPNIFIID